VDWRPLLLEHVFMGGVGVGNCAITMRPRLKREGSRGSTLISYLVVRIVVQDEYHGPDGSGENSMGQSLQARPPTSAGDADARFVHILSKKFELLVGKIGCIIVSLDMIH
jgi:hypothetical protein